MATIAPPHPSSEQIDRLSPRYGKTVSTRHPNERSDKRFMFARERQQVANARHIALVGNYTPQRCGLATFTADTHEALLAHDHAPTVDTYILRDSKELAYPSKVENFIRRGVRSDYREAARQIDRSGAQLMFVQHEFGIFGGDNGEYILDLIEAVQVPVVVTLHTILDEPTHGQNAIMERLVAAVDMLVVMAEYGRSILRHHYNVGDAKIAVIPHGIPDLPYTRPAAAKAQFDLQDRQVIMTFGLLSHDKGIDRMIEAMPDIVKVNPNALYVILGATHPNIIEMEGEALRHRLQDRAHELGVAANIRWIDAFVEMDELVEYLKATDVYVTPYLNPKQITSGTLSYAVGMGKPVVSTPYIHASELLANDTGVLVPFRDSGALAREVSELLCNNERRMKIARTAYDRGREMTWDKYAQALLTRFGRILGNQYNSIAEPLTTASAA
ncbi:MAG: glycosyltransferase family 4 protein [Pontixanthobacter sp.]